MPRATMIAKKYLFGFLSGLGRFPSKECSRTLSSSKTELPTQNIRDIVKSFREWGFREFWSPGRSPVKKAVLASSQSELPPRRMTDSYEDAVIPLASNRRLREKYLTFFNTVRFGRLLEDLDILAGIIAYKHNAHPTCGPERLSSMGIVTAAVDQIQMKGGVLVPDRDVYVGGHVTWVGASSMEVTMEVKQEHDGVISPVIDARLLMVARDPTTGGKAFVNPLEVTTPEEAELVSAGKAHKTRRELCAKRSLLRTPPTEKERLMVHDLFLQTVDEAAVTFKHPIKPEESVWMEDTILKNVIICHPERRNIHNKIFGGFLMRKSFELGWATASLFSKMQPAVYAVDDIIFAKPVSIGSLLYLSSQVVYTCGAFIQVCVHAEVVDPKTGRHETTNVLHFTYKTDSNPRPVIPKSYAEFMMYLDGKRRQTEMTSSQ